MALIDDEIKGAEFELYGMDNFCLKQMLHFLVSKSVLFLLATNKVMLLLHPTIVCQQIPTLSLS
jgi:hypothetical protein